MLAVSPDPASPPDSSMPPVPPVPPMRWCGFDCEHAAVAGTEHTTGGCRREIPLYCQKFAKYVRKNQLCIAVTRAMQARDTEYQRRFGKNLKDDGR